MIHLPKMKVAPKRKADPDCKCKSYLTPSYSVLKFELPDPKEQAKQLTRPPGTVVKKRLKKLPDPPECKSKYQRPPPSIPPSKSKSVESETHKPIVTIPPREYTLSGYKSKSTAVSRPLALDMSSLPDEHYEGLVAAIHRRLRELKYSNIEEYLEVLELLEDNKNSSGMSERATRRSLLYTNPDEMKLKHTKWAKPCGESFVAGRPKGYIGTCPPNYEKLAKFNKPKQKFFLTQDPRKKYCLRNPQVLRTKPLTKKKEFDVLTKMVKHAENICASTESEKSDPYICEVVDIENPLQLDFQGMDYKNTYEHDEQDIQNMRIFRRVCRFMERKHVKMEIEKNVEDELQRERIAVPDCFHVENRNPKIEPTPSIESIHYGKLYRAIDKPINQKHIAKEKKRRLDRYKSLYLQRKDKMKKQQEIDKAQAERDEEYFASNVAMKSFQNTVKDIDEIIRRTVTKERIITKVEHKRRLFPHTMRELLEFKKFIKHKNRLLRDKALIKKKFFYERTGAEKDYPEAKLEISSSEASKFSVTPTLTEQSSDDEDNLEVGKDEDRVKLRGFHFRLGDHIRGKLHQRQRPDAIRTKGCITRDQWLDDLAPPRDPVKLDVEVGYLHRSKPDDPQLRLFTPEFGVKPPVAKYSAIRQFIERRLGRHYDRVLRKDIKLAQPKLRYKVKKFNLISFLYGDTRKRFEPIELRDSAALHAAYREKSTLEYMEARTRLRQTKRELMKQKRMQILGIPCNYVKKSRLETDCENTESDSADEDWVPELDSEISESSLEKARSVRVPLRMRGNMPAPEHRETTLRRHPRHPRDYAGLRVPSKLFNDAIKPGGLPHLRKPPGDLINYANVDVTKRPYTDMFNARHHHDHWNPTQQKILDVHYQAEVVKPEVTKVKCKADKIIMENFKMASPPCNAFVDMDLTMPKFDIDGMIHKVRDKPKDRPVEIIDDVPENICKKYDYVFHSRPAEEIESLNFPGHDGYVKVLKDLRDKLYDLGRHGSKFRQWGALDKDALLKELEEDLKSIETCLTSLSSSECTNLTNDSGSYLLMEGKTKLPLDYIRKSVIPFEEMQRSRFNVQPIDVDAEENNPFKVLPFSGQKKEQRDFLAAKDAFFTFNTRLQNGLRLRLEVPVVDVREKLLGYGSHKYPGLVTTDIDENYVDELRNRPPVKLFNFKSCRPLIKQALRFKFVSLLIQGQMVRAKIYERLNARHWQNIHRAKFLYERLFAKWEKREYEAAMTVVYKVKSFYDLTDVLKDDYHELERVNVILNMDIVFIEGTWVRRMMLQNFHYLLGDYDWRYKHDWIHRLPDNENELESYEESIRKRSTVNLRPRDQDDAWAIKSFYKNVYLKNKHPIEVVFENAQTFMDGIELLKSKTFVLLLELHFTLALHTELKGRLTSFEKWCADDLRDKEEYVERKCAKKYFMTDRADELRKRTIEFVKRPIDVTFNDRIFNRDRAIVAEVWREIVPSNMRGSSEQDLDPTDMVAMMSDVVLELISKFENIPVALSRRVEVETRRERRHERKQSHQAYLVEKRIDLEMRKVRKNLDPPYVKPKRVGKLPRILIKKKVKPPPVEEKQISEYTKFFFRAFHDDGDVMQSGDARESLVVVDTMQEQIVPFYFDHFLKLNGYTPNYNFQTQIDMRDGPEIERFRIRTVIPEIRDKMSRWEAMRKRKMEDSIAKNPKMYENVNF